MSNRDKLLSKNGMATILLSREFLKSHIGDKVPTVTELSKLVGFSRGTIQNSIKFLQENKAIRLNSRGHLGTFIVSKDTRVLLDFARITSIVGVMPLPYSRKYEGFATGLITTMENKYLIPTNMAYMRGARNRASMVLAGRYDFAVVSYFAAKKIIESNKNLVIIKRFGKHSYLSEHVLLFHDSKESEIKEKMRVGLDVDSVDHVQLTQQVCDSKDVEYIQMDYSQILNKIISGDIDVAVWNLDEILDKEVKVNYVKLDTEDLGDTEACIVCNKDSQELVVLLDEIIDIDVVLETQKLVLDHKLTPSY